MTTGSVRQKRGERGIRRYLPGGWSDETLPVNAFLVEHPEGLCLFDTGQIAAAGRPGYFPFWHPFFRLARFELGPADEVASQLRRSEIDARAVRWVVLSHLHTDHVGGVGPLRHAEVLVSRREWQLARGLGGRLRGYLPGRWPLGLEPRLIDLDESPVGPFQGTFDLAGDGSLVIVPTPGHTEGHISLLVSTGERTYLLGGDLAHSPADLDRAAPHVSDFCRSSGVLFLATHDPNVPRLLRSPDLAPR